MVACLHITLAVAWVCVARPSNESMYICTGSSCICAYMCSFKSRFAQQVQYKHFGRILVWVIPVVHAPDVT